jgi:hypothetical protein
MNIIFLDIDGVLRTDKSDKYWSSITGKAIPKIVFDRNFDKNAISTINEIIHYTGAKVVITSTWRVQHSLEQLKLIFKSRGFQGEIIDITNVGYSRGEEIQEWLDTHTVNKYVVIDDNIKDIQVHINPKRIIHCNPNIGLCSDQFEKITDLLL